MALSTEIIKGLYKQFKPLIKRVLKDTKAYGDEAEAQADFKLKMMLMDENFNPNLPVQQQYQYLREGMKNDLYQFMTAENRNTFKIQGHTYASKGIDPATSKPFEVRPAVSLDKEIELADGPVSLHEIIKSPLPENEARDKLIGEFGEAVKSKLPENKNSSKILQMMLEDKYLSAANGKYGGNATQRKTGRWSAWDLTLMAKDLGVSPAYLSQELERTVAKPPAALLKFKPE